MTLSGAVLRLLAALALTPFVTFAFDLGGIAVPAWVATPWALVLVQVGWVVLDSRWLDPWDVDQ